VLKEERLIITYALGVILAALQAPSRDSLIAEGIRLTDMRPAEALIRFEGLLARDTLDIEANWRAAVARSDMALPLRDKKTRPLRDSLLSRAQIEARRAVALAPADVDALFALGLVLGNTALTRGIKEKVRMAREIRSVALRAVAADSTHSGAHHLLGRWNYEVMRLSGFERFVAKNILGGGVFGQASWEEAQAELESAVRLDPERIYHRLVLGRILAARKDPAAARDQLARIAALPARVAADSTYRREAVELLASLRAS
jgi:hypothetical protein